jgi:hypothetical protein
MQSSDRHADHEHEHCQILSDRRDGTCDQIAIADSTPPAIHLIEPFAGLAPSISHRLYRLAPKLSPPRTV